MVGGLQQPWSEEAEERETDSHENILEDHRGDDDSGDGDDGGDEKEEDLFKDVLEDYEVDKKKDARYTKITLGRVIDKDAPWTSCTQRLPWTSCT